MSSHITADSSQMHLDDPYQSIRHSLAKKVAPSFHITYAPPTHNTANMGSPNASKGRCTFAHDILTAEPSQLNHIPNHHPSRLTRIIPLSSSPPPPKPYSINPPYFFSCCAALAVSFCKSSMDFCASLWSPRSALMALSLSLARPSCHWPLPCFCSFSCCCFSFSASSGRASLSARGK
jgi:hypothetical protein